MIKRLATVIWWIGLLCLIAGAIGTLLAYRDFDGRYTLLPYTDEFPPWERYKQLLPPEGQSKPIPPDAVTWDAAPASAPRDLLAEAGIAMQPVQRGEASADSTPAQPRPNPWLSVDVLAALMAGVLLCGAAWSASFVIGGSFWRPPR